MRSLVPSLTVLIALTLLLAGCLGSSTKTLPPRGAPTMSCGARAAYTDSQHGYGYCHDPAWTKYENSGVVGFSSPSEGSSDNFSENINMVTEVLPGGVGLAGYVQANLDHLPSYASDVKVLAKTPVKFGGLDAWRVEYTGTFSGIHLHNEATLVVHAGLGHVFTYSAQEGHSQVFLGEARAVADSMKFV